jgi:pimeloyl-ACP methyl ester carboxylesterase
MPAALSRRPLLLFGALVVLGIAVWAAATVLIEPNHTFVSQESCPNSAFSCVTLRVPRDHFGDDGTEWDATFAVQRATESPRKGVIVVIVGGPGQAGVPSADSYTGYFAEGITDAYDIVFFDQRGVGSTAPLQCPQAALRWFGADDSPTGSSAEQQAYATDTEQFVTDCVTETGVPADEFQYYSTRQAIEDLEVFRAWDGADKLILYGESYGTQYAQEYAAAHPDHVQALIIDGPVDLTHSGTDYYAETAHAAADVLKLVLDDCTDDPHCAADVDGGDETAAYDHLAAQLRTGPLSVDFVTSAGDVESRELTLNDLELSMDYALSPSADRMYLQRAIAQASHGELQPLAHLVYAALGQDPDTLGKVPDLTWSDAMYFSVDCSDYAFGSGSAEERLASYFAAGQTAGVDDLRLGSGYFLDLPCAYWPAHGPEARPTYLTDPTYPVFILGATWDPYTPYPNAERLAQNIPGSYSIIQPGGPHVIYLRGESCPDDDISAYLLDGILPTSHRIECAFLGVDDYVPIPAQDAGDYGSTRAALSAIDDEINTNTEWEYWDGAHVLQMGCMKGGTITYEANEQGYQVSLEDCAFSDGLALTGVGEIADDGTFTLDVTTDGGAHLTYRRDAEGDRTSTGELDS